MSDYSGILFPSASHAVPSLLDSSYEAEFPHVLEKAYNISLPIFGTHTEVEKTQTVSDYNGDIFNAFLNDFYFRFIIEPNPIDFGYILNDVEETFTVWNGYFTSKTCTDIEQVGGEEFTLSGLTAPFTLYGMDDTEYTITASLEGSPTIDSSIFFDFGETTEYTILYLEGIRVVLFPYPPLLPMSETLEWATDIITSKKGYEQRISTRRIPRQGYKISIYVPDQFEQSKIEALFHSWLKRSFGLPVWSDWVEHTGDIDIDDTVINVDTTKSDFRDDGIAVIWEDEDNYEIVKIDTVATDSLTLSNPVQSNHTGTKLIMPARITQINTPITRSVAPDGYESANISFVCRFNDTLSGYSAGTTYKGLTVLTQATYVDGSQSKEMSGDIVIVDEGSGLFEIYSDSDFNVTTQSHIFKNFTKEQTWNHRLFLHSLIGRLNAVWIPTFRKDLVNTEVIESGDTEIRVSNINLKNNMPINIMRTDLAFIFDDGSMIFRELTNISELSSTEEIITIDSSLGVEVPPDGCKISYLDKARLTSDQVSIEWQTSSRNSSNLKFQRVHDDAFEDVGSFVELSP